MSWARIREILDRPLFRTRARPRRERGIALLVVTASLAILTAVAIEFRYQTAIDVQLAANERDALRAEYLAKSGVAVSRLVLRFQRQLSASTNVLKGPLDGLIKSMAGSNTNALAGLSGSLAPNIQLWKLLPIDSSFFTTFLAGGTSAGGAAFGGGGSVGATFGEFSGDFTAKIESEETKFNLNRLNSPGATGVAGMRQGLALLSDPRLAFLFDKEDAWHVQMKPEEVLVALHDWIDPQDNQASINLTSPINAWNEGSGDENRYSLSRYPHKYRSKNSYYDSLDEIFQVDGCSDLFAAAFYDRLTVWSDKNYALNPNSDDPLQIYLGIVSAAANPTDPKLSISPPSMAIGLIFQQLQMLKSFGGMFGGITVQQFVSIIQANGIVLRPEVQNPNNPYFTDKAETFSIKATGHVGEVDKTLHVVVRTDNLLGKMMYYREE